MWRGNAGIRGLLDFCRSEYLDSRHQRQKEGAGILQRKYLGFLRVEALKYDFLQFLDHFVFGNRDPVQFLRHFLR